MGAEADAAPPELVDDVDEVTLDDGAAQRQLEVAEAQAEELLVRQPDPRWLALARRTSIRARW